MSKVLLFSHSGFSDQNANGITMKNLLSAWEATEKAEYYCDVQPPDYTAAHNYFRVTDMDVVKSFLGRREQHVFTFDEEQVTSPGQQRDSQGISRSIPAAWKRRKYDFRLKWLREIMRMIGPWGHRKLRQWINEFAPDVLVYMVGESIAMDRVVLKAVRRTGKPLVLYNGEAYRIIDLKQRRGLERAYYRATKKLYMRLAECASLEIFNCPMLEESYAAEYGVHGKSIVAYNSADSDLPPYKPGEHMIITYFGNLGVGRVESLLETAEVLHDIDPDLFLDIYGQAKAEDEEKFTSRSNIRYHGFVDAKTLKTVMEKSDILLHVESFDEEISKKLKYAFSTKIAQCLCSGRCFISFAPLGTVSSQYLVSVGAAVASTRQELKGLMKEMIEDSVQRNDFARKLQVIGCANHNMLTTADMVKKMIEEYIAE